MESLGYSHKLQLTTACPFVLDIFTKKPGACELSLIDVCEGGDVMYNALIESIKTSSTRYASLQSKFVFSLFDFIKN